MSSAAEAPLEARAERRLKPVQIYVVGLILLVTICNYLDRIVLSVLQEPIKHELRLADWQLGLLNGPAFALLYSAAGIPVSRLAERMNRASLLSFVAALWSIATSLCAAAQGFGQLLLFRLGVGMAEGGCVPITHSILADHFTARQRGLVMAVVSSAPSFATILAPIIGGLVAEAWGWRAAFLVVGLPGLALALLVRFTLKDERKPREERDPARRPGTFREDFVWLMRTPAFVYTCIGGALIGVGNGGVVAFTVSFLVRNHHLPLTKAGGVVGMTGIAGLVGAFIGGLAADRFSDARGRSYVITPAVGAVLACAVYAAAYSVSDWRLAFPLLLGGALAYNIKNGPIYAAVQNIVPGRMRATGTAVYMFGATTIGSTVGPLLTGALSDVFAARAFPSALGAFGTMCPGGRPLPGAAVALQDACAAASAMGVRQALIANVTAFLLSAAALAMAARTIRITEPDMPQTAS